jgi:succinyl-CoA synthetase beta subunit
MGGEKWAVKAQIHAGGRGKGGGIRLAKSLDEVESLTSDMIGSVLVTHQTGPEGKVVRKVLIEEACDIEGELYLGIVIDRSASKPVMMASSQGGVEIEEVARSNPEAIVREHIDPLTGLMPFQARKLAYGMRITDRELAGGLVKFMLGLYRVFVGCDCSLAEINPLVVTGDKGILALDAKLNFDDNSLYRHPGIAKLRDPEEEDPREVAARESKLSYVKLDGNIGCMVNGAGLAMATMDTIKLHGGEPANFLDVGGGVTAESVSDALRILLSDEGVEAVLVNIFGGIVKCDLIAEGIVSAVNEIRPKVPIVVRLEGTNVEIGKRILGESGLEFISAGSMKEAAELVVKAAG